jgi:hypothetical protein
MTLWNKTATLPKYLTRADKRNVVVTKIGFVRRFVRTNVFNNTSIKDETLEAIGGLANSSNFGSPKITDVWHTVSASPLAAVRTLVEKRTLTSGTVAKTGGVSNTLVNGTGTAFTTQLPAGTRFKINQTYHTVVSVANTTRMTITPATTATANVAVRIDTPTVNTYISFSEPVSQSGLAGKTKMNIANTVSGNTMVARTANVSVFSTHHLLYRWRPITLGTYKVQAQTIANSTATAANTRSTNGGTEAVSLVISAAVSNTNGTFVYSLT